MKGIITFMAIILFMNVHGQEDGSRLNSNNARLLTDDTIAEALVNLAMNNPEIISADHIASQNEYAYRRNRTNWLDNVVLSGNVNEFSIKESGPTADPLLQSTQYPRYNIGVRLPLGLFINNSKETKSAFYKYQSTLSEIDRIKQDIRKQVLMLYEDYKMNKEIKALQQELLQDVRFLLAKTEEKFEKGEVSLDVYTNASKAYNAEKVKMITLDHNLRVTEAQLEALIGMKLSDALQQLSVQKN